MSASNPLGSGNFCRLGGPRLIPVHTSVASSSLDLFFATDISNAPRLGAPFSLIKSANCFCGIRPHKSVKILLASFLNTCHDLHASMEIYPSTG